MGPRKKTYGSWLRKTAQGILPRSGRLGGGSPRRPVSRRRTLSRIVQSSEVRAAIAHESRRPQGAARRELLRTAHGYADEVADNYRPWFPDMIAPPVRLLLSRMFRPIRLWNAHILDAIHRDGSEVVYLPSHRSHLDELVMSYVIHRAGHRVPLIAAGHNLDLPIIGSVMRLGGAFFIRRRLQGNGLYTAVLMRYLSHVIASGQPIEFFIEGGRSRTGFLLTPKTGLLRGTVESFLEHRARPVVFVPIYIAYDRIVESTSYASELKGKKKRQESTGGFVRGLRVLRERFGGVHINVGEPIPLDQVLDRQRPGWQMQHEVDPSSRHWIKKAVDEIAETAARRINRAAVVTPASLVSLALLASPSRSLPLAELERQVAMLRELTCEVMPDASAPVAELNASQVISAMRRAGVVSGRLVNGEQHLALKGTAARTNAAYAQSNVMHLFLIPALVAKWLCAEPPLSHADIKARTLRVYGLLRSTLFLELAPHEQQQLVDACIRFLEERVAPADLAPLPALATCVLSDCYRAAAVIVGLHGTQVKAREVLPAPGAPSKSTRSASQALDSSYRLTAEQFVGYVCKENLLWNADGGRLDMAPELHDWAADAGEFLQAGR